MAASSCRPGVTSSSRPYAPTQSASVAASTAAAPFNTLNALILSYIDTGAYQHRRDQHRRRQRVHDTLPVVVLIQRRPGPVHLQRQCQLQYRRQVCRRQGGGGGEKKKLQHDRQRDLCL